MSTRRGAADRIDLVIEQLLASEDAENAARWSPVAPNSMG